MKTVLSSLISLILIFLLTSSFCIRKKTAQQPVQSDNAGLTLPEGFTARVFADNLGSGRHIAINSNGDLYLALRSLHSGNGIVALRDADKDGKAEMVKYFGKSITTGIDISNGFLYYSNFKEVMRVPLKPGELVPAGEPVVIATGFPSQNQHQDKTFALDGNGNLVC